MHQDPSERLLKSPLSALGFSEDFKTKCRKMCVGTLAEIVAINPEELRQKKGFDYTWLGELVRFLRQANLLHLLQPVPGSVDD